MSSLLSPPGMFGWSFFMNGMSGAAAKVEKNVMKKPNHDAWNARMCGLLQLRIGSAVALCSASTGTEKRLPKMSDIPRLLTPSRSKHA